MEEQAKILRKEVWLRPPIDPIKVEAIINKKIASENREYDRIIRGANFCQVNKSKEFNQDNPSITFGNQKWKGAAPNFKSIVELMIKF